MGGTYPYPQHVMYPPPPPGALTSLASNQHEMVVSNWLSETIDEIIDIGDSHFLNALQRGSISDAPTLSVEQLPTTAQFARSSENDDDLPTVASNEISKPRTVVMPHLTMKTNTSEMPNEAPNNSHFPIVERKSMEIFLKALSLVIPRMIMIHHSFPCIQHWKMFLLVKPLQFSY